MCSLARRSAHFNSNYEYVLDKEIGKVFSYRLALAGNGKRSSSR